MHATVLAVVFITGNLLEEELHFKLKWIIASWRLIRWFQEVCFVFVFVFFFFYNKSPEGSSHDQVSWWRTCCLWWTVKQWHQFANVMWMLIMVMGLSSPSWVVFLRLLPANSLSDIQTLLSCLTTLASPLSRLIFISVLHIHSAFLFLACFTSDCLFSICRNCLHRQVIHLLLK